ncbi:glycosyltransferase [Coleofasciculus sp. FACHB-64]|uniref:glycosyltransferase n=1 Tax=Cyanophyceae TaxID=3028117 RepID=UPI001681DA5E|nr:glycosyltransferase [Coleofasciculus sp. FACHB-64]MBD2046336.1 glycosyltransferase [Coleofasciculus sp. FACHB-64]
MRIAFIVGKFPTVSETFILNQIVGLIERGHEIDIYAQKPGDTAKIHPDVERYQLLDRTYYVPEQRPANPLIYVIKAIWLLLANFPKNPVAFLRSLNVFKYGKEAASLRMLYTTFSLLPFLSNKPYDIIHCQFGPLGFLGMYFRTIAASRAKVIISFRGSDLTMYLSQYGDDIYKKLFEKGDCFLPICKHFKNKLISLGCNEKKIIVLRSGIDCNRFSFKTRYPHPDGKVRIVSTGRLIEKKGIEYGIRAIANLTKMNLNVEYNIIGDGSLKPDLQQLIQELDVGNIVNLLGWKQQQEVVQILNNSHIFVAPCVTSKDNNQEGIPNVLKEAMAMGLPVASTYHSGIPELVEDGVSGFLVAERDVNALTEKLGYLIAHPEVWPEMGAAGRAYVEKHYEIGQLNDHLVEIYEKLLIT